ncbi:MAG: tetratricopeptide repeat protein [Planctomycetes bacterium]|nr:tetratricopeptide repeat protein [Planctomycetota bacterium]
MSTRVRLFIFLISLAGWQVAAGLESTAPSQRAPHRLMADAVDGRLDDFTLLEAALIAGGCGPEDVQRALDNYRRSRNNLFREISEDQSPEEKSRNLFRLMHKAVLTGKYELSSSSVAETLSNGDYNCLSATIIYQSLCNEIHLPVVSVALPGHVRNQFRGRTQFAIEPTCAEWFDRRSIRRSTTQRWPAENRPVTEITNVQLIARVYYNRATDHLSHRRFGDAVDMLQFCVKLDPEHAASRTNLLAALNNWALALCEDGHFAKAAQRLNEGFALAPRHEPFLANDLYVRGRWVRALCEQGDFRRALSILQAAQRRRPTVSMFCQGQVVVIDLWARSLAENSKDEDPVLSVHRIAKTLIEQGQSELADRMRKKVRTLTAKVADPRLTTGDM